MAKNLKLNIKNTQLAKALNLNSEKPATPKEMAEKTEKPLSAAAPEVSEKDLSIPSEEEPRKVKARAKNSPPPPKEEAKETKKEDKFSLQLSSEESYLLEKEEEERKMRIAKSRSFLLDTSSDDSSDLSKSDKDDKPRAQESLSFKEEAKILAAEKSSSSEKAETILTNKDEISIDSPKEAKTYKKPFDNSFEKSSNRSFDKDQDRTSERSSSSFTERKPYPPREGSFERKPYPPREGSFERKPYPPREGSSDRPQYPPREGSFERKPYPPREGSSDRPQYPPREGSFERKPYPPREGSFERKPYPPREGSFERKPYPPREGSFERKPYPPREGSFERKPYPPREGFTSQEPYVPRRPSVPFSEQRAQREGFQPPAERTYEPRVKLGPTGKHVKDLIKPRPISSKGSDTRYPKKPGVVDPRAHAEPPKAQDGPVRQHKKSEGSPTDELEVKKSVLKAKDFTDIKSAKKSSVRGFDARDRKGLTQGDDENWRKKRPSKLSRSNDASAPILRPTQVKVRLPISIKDLASEMKLKASELIAKLFMQGMIVTLNDLLDDETTIQLLGQEFGCTIEIDTQEEERIKVTSKSVQEEIKSATSDDLIIRPPVVTFMGHVDHGKTSLIDSIRKSNRVSAEAGAITQHIGAFKCHTKVGQLTILDTPGHEAFSAMRTRGASVTDIVVLVIAGDEGMKQQTIEAMNQAKEAGVTIVVALNKCDKPGFNPEQAYQQLATHELLPEAWGGSTITVNCSAVTGEGIDQLLEMLALQAEVMELRANPTTRARGSVLESELHKGFGPQATVLVQNGTLKLGDAVVFDNLYGKIKTMRDERGISIKEAGPSTPVAITGLSGLPEAGSQFIVVKNDKEAKEIAEARAEGIKKVMLQKRKVSLENLVQQAAGSQKKIANFILRADVQGSLEALKASLLNIRSTKIEVNIINAGVGEVSESDIELAAASSAIIIGFHTQIESHADSMIKQKAVKVILFDVIYHAIEEVKKLLVNMLDKIAQERELGHAEVLATFKASQLGVIAGCIVQDGTIVKNQKFRLIRNKEVIWKGSISSLKRVKEDVREVKKGLECGILLSGFNEVAEGDTIQCYEVYYLTQEL